MGEGKEMGIESSFRGVFSVSSFLFAFPAKVKTTKGWS